MKMACFDLETTNLRANFGRLIVACFAELNNDNVVIMRADDKKYRCKNIGDDSKLALAVKEYLEECWMWVGYNSKMYDIPFLNTRLMLADEKPVDRRLHADLLYYCRRPHLNLNNARLDTVAKTFRLKEQKTVLDPDIWVNAMMLDKEALDYVAEHCVQDVLVLKEVFPILAPNIRNIHY